MRICAYAVMPNHWHLLLWPECDGELAAFMQRLTITHVRRWQEHRGYAGLGHVYQGRYKAFPIAEDDHLVTVLRYVERNAVRAELVPKAEDWSWSSLPGWLRGDPLLWRGEILVHDEKWLERVNKPLSAGDLQRLRHSVSRGRPFGGEPWTRETAIRLGLESCLRPRGRPRKEKS